MGEDLGARLETLAFTVPGLSCAHCEAAVGKEVARVPGVTAVSVDLPARRVAVEGESLDEAAIRAAIQEAGYEAA